MESYVKTFERSIKKWWLQKALCNYGGAQYTYEDLAKAIAKLHILFENAGIKKGDHIALCAKNSAEWGACFLAITSYRAVVVPILYDFTPEAVESLVNHSDATLLFTDSELFKKLDPAAMGSLRAIISADAAPKDFEGFKPLFNLSFTSDKAFEKAYKNLDKDFEAKYPEGFTRDCVSYPEGDGNELALINYTSGTTSSPKGVMLRYLNLDDQVAFCIRNLPATPADSLVSMLPMAHMYGMMIEFLYPVCSGATIYFLGKTPSPSLLLGAMKQVRPYLMASVPLVMEKIYKRSLQGTLHKLRFVLWIPGVNTLIYRKMGRKVMEAFGGKLKMIVLGGAPMNREAEKAFRHIGLPYLVGFGMTEGAPLITYEHNSRYIPGTCGKPIHQLRIESEDPRHIAGEILVAGDNICMGYYKNPEATAAAFTPDGYLRTGDLGVFDSSGNLIIKGRSKTMILSSNGQNIYPEEIESMFNAENYISESIVVSRAGRLVALLYLDKDKIKADSLDQEAVADIPAKVVAAVNKMLPNYSQITKAEVMLEPFAKTPKMSIKRYLYK